MIWCGYSTLSLHKAEYRLTPQQDSRRVASESPGTHQVGFLLKEWTAHGNGQRASALKAKSHQGETLPNQIKMQMDITFLCAGPLDYRRGSHLARGFLAIKSLGKNTLGQNVQNKNHTQEYF